MYEFTFYLIAVLYIFIYTAPVYYTVKRQTAGRPTVVPTGIVQVPVRGPVYRLKNVVPGNNNIITTVSLESFVLALATRHSVARRYACTRSAISA